MNIGGGLAYRLDVNVDSVGVGRCCFASRGQRGRTATSLHAWAAAASLHEDAGAPFAEALLQHGSS